jgi:hypothetical protein
VVSVDEAVIIMEAWRTEVAEFADACSKGGVPISADIARAKKELQRIYEQN